MAIYYPQINMGAPTVTRQFSTLKQDLETGRRGAYSHWLAPLRTWDIMHYMDDAQRATLEAFHAARGGRLETFTFLDPEGNMVPASEDFADASWQAITATPGAPAADPYGGMLAQSVAGSSANSMLAAHVLPAGDGSGLMLCGSVYVKAPVAMSLHIGFVDSGFSVLAGTTWSLPAGQWRRIWQTVTLATNLPVRLLIGGLATWGAAVSLDLFGAQCVPLGGPGAYAKTPGRYGVTTARFDADMLAVTTVAPGAHTARVQIAEVR